MLNKVMSNTCQKKVVSRSGREHGFTITELMITIALSLSVIGSVLVGYMATYTSSMNTLAASRMNQDLNAVMGLIITELRRAGYSGDAASATDPTTNVFNQPGSTALEVHDNMAADNVLVSDLSNGWTNASSPAATDGSCIVYAYDLDEDGVVDTDELGGFRLNSGAVEFRRLGNVANPNTCSSTSNTWEALTDSDFITITALTFNLDNSQCLNTREPNGVENGGDGGVIDDAPEFDCYDVAPLTSDITVETRQIDITITGNLTDDSFVTVSLNQDVRIRNELVRVR